MTDPISNFLVQIENGGAVGRACVVVPYSNHKFEIAKILERERYVAAVTKKGKRTKRWLEVALKYRDGKPRVQGTKRISKPSRRVYMGVADIRPVKQGYGLIFLSTPRGILTGEEARKERVGGEALFMIW